MSFANATSVVQTRSPGPASVATMIIIMPVTSEAGRTHAS
jgi:hypothetical protein